GGRPEKFPEAFGENQSFAFLSASDPIVTVFRFAVLDWSWSNSMRQATALSFATQIFNAPTLNRKNQFGRQKLRTNCKKPRSPAFSPLKSHFWSSKTIG